jgi:pimeloyl-ACP methyl ester carboxylesterase
MKQLDHGRVRLALRELRTGSGPILLAVHALGGSGADWTDALGPWPGSAYALDLTGHGESAPLRGDGYYPELLAGDVDVAVAAVGATHLVGRGLGAYLALLVAGCRPAAIRGALLLPGAGLDGGGSDLRFTDVAARFEPFRQAHPEAQNGGPDPLLRILSTDIRPADYARTFGERAHTLLLAEDGTPRPPWWSVLRDVPGAQPAPVDLGAALERLALAR